MSIYIAVKNWNVIRYKVLRCRTMGKAMGFQEVRGGVRELNERVAEKVVREKQV